MIIKVTIPHQIQLKVAPKFKSMFFSKKGEIHYIGGAEILPPPLNAEEESRAIMGLETEQEQQARSKLIEHNLRLVVYIAKKFDNTGVGVEDLISIGTIGLIKAINTFNRNKNIKLATYASRCIENEILMYMRVKKKLQRESSYYEPIGTDKEGNEIQLLDIIESGEPTAMEQIGLKDDTKKMYDLLKNVLSERERQVVIMRYGLYYGREYTQKEIARKMGISRSYISRIEKNALNRLREYFRD